jgi:hypothetical protein
MLFDKRDPKLLQQKPCKGAETNSVAKFGKETAAGGAQKPKWVLCYRRRLAQGMLRMLRLCSGSDQVRSPSAQVKAAATHVLRLKQNGQG